MNIPRRWFLSLPLGALLFKRGWAGEDLPAKFPIEPTAYPDLMWGTFGKNGDQPLQWVPLGGCSTEHLQAILRTQHQLSPFYRSIIINILKIRKRMEEENPALRKNHYEHPETAESCTS